MAKFIGSHLKTDNWGEDFFVKKLMEYFDDSYVICRNRPVFGAQFDVCLLAPNIGIIIFEVKAWKRDTWCHTPEYYSITGLPPAKQSPSSGI